MTPYIHKRADGSVEIIGEPAGLEALGHALLLKAKMGSRFQCTIADGTNPPIKIISSDELPAEERKP